MIRVSWNCPAFPTYHGVIYYSQEEKNFQKTESCLRSLFTNYLTISLNKWSVTSRRDAAGRLPYFIQTHFPTILKLYVRCPQIRVLECHVQRLRVGMRRNIFFSSLKNNEIFIELYCVKEKDTYFAEILIRMCPDWRECLPKWRGSNLPRCIVPE